MIGAHFFSLRGPPLFSDKSGRPIPSFLSPCKWTGFFSHAAFSPPFPPAQSLRRFSPPRFKPTCMFFLPPLFLLTGSSAPFFLEKIHDLPNYPSVSRFLLPCNFPGWSLVLFRPSPGVSGLGMVFFPSHTKTSWNITCG